MTAGEGASRILGQLERIGLTEQPKGLIISENLLIGAHLRLCDITRLESWTHPIGRVRNHCCGCCTLGMSGNVEGHGISSAPLHPANALLPETQVLIEVLGQSRSLP